MVAERVNEVVEGLRRIRPYFRKIFSFATDLSNLEILILTILIERKERKVSLSELRELLYPMSFSKLSMVTTKLENNKLVKKVKFPNDRRKVELRITQKGIKKYEQFENIMKEFIAEGINEMTDEEFEILKKSFDIWIKLLKNSLYK